MTAQFTNTETALAHIEAYLNGGDELGEVPEADAVAALAYLRLVTAPATDARLTEIEARQNHARELDLFFEANILIKQDIPYLLAEIKRLRALQQGPSPVAAPAAGADAGSYTFELPIEKKLRQELAQAQEQYRTAMGNLIARKLDLNESRRQLDTANTRIKSLETSLTEYATQNDELSNAIRTIGDSMAKASDARANSIIRVNYERIQELEAGNLRFQQLVNTILNPRIDELNTRIQSLEAGLRRLLQALERAGVEKAFDGAVFEDLNDALCDAALLAENKGEKDNGNG